MVAGALMDSEFLILPQVYSEHISRDYKISHSELNNTSNINAGYHIINTIISSDELDVLEQINDEFAHVIVSGRSQIISRCEDICGNLTFSCESISDFEHRFLHVRSIAKMNVGKAWLHWQGKNFYPDGIVFYAGTQKVKSTQLNLFTGFKCEPKRGDITFFLDYIHEFICCRNVVHAKYVTQFLAHMLQKPDEKPSVALVLKTEKTAGNHFLFQIISAMLAEYCMSTEAAELFKKRSNNAFANKLLFFVNNMCLRSLRDARQLSSLIDAQFIDVNLKRNISIVVQCCSRFILSLSKMNAVSAYVSEQRYLVLESNDVCSSDEQYYSDVRRFCKENVEYLMHYLLNLDISDFNPHVAPLCQSLVADKIASLTPSLGFFYEELLSEAPFKGARNSLDVGMLHACFLAFLEKQNVEMTPAQIRSLLGKLCKTLGMRKNGRSGRNLHYEFSSIQDLRVRLSTLLNENVENLFK